MFKKLSTTLLGAAAALTILGGIASAADWRAWNIHNEGHPNHGAMDRFAELVDTATKGEIKVQVFHGGVLGSQPDALEQVRIGAIEIGNFNLGPIGPMVKEANLVSLPFIFKSVPHMFRVLDGEAGDIHLARPRGDFVRGDDPDAGDAVSHDQHVAAVPGIPGSVEDLAAPEEDRRTLLGLRRRRRGAGEAERHAGKQERSESDRQVVHGAHPTGTAPYTRPQS